MSLGQLLGDAYAWLDARAAELLVVAVLIPACGTVLAWAGKGGSTDRDGRVIASVLVGLGLGVFLVSVLAALLAHVAFGRSPFEANVLLVLAPVVCLVGCLAGVRALFPLSELASVRTFTDVASFVGACLAVLWLFSKFRGWGIVFWGNLGQLLIIGVLGFLLLRRLYRRAFRR